LLAILWDRGESTVSDVWEAILERREVARNTVQTMLTRLAEKGWLRYRAVGKSFLFEAAVPRQRAQRLLAGRMVDSLFKGSTERLMMTLLEDRGLDPEEADRIRAMLDEAGGATKR
jgi:predicted transcriptional regulator